VTEALANVAPLRCEIQDDGIIITVQIQKLPSDKTAAQRSRPDSQLG